LFVLFRKGKAGKRSFKKSTTTLKLKGLERLSEMFISPKHLFKMWSAFCPLQLGNFFKQSDPSVAEGSLKGRGRDLKKTQSQQQHRPERKAIYWKGMGWG
jgi:hypothetical protein